MACGCGATEKTVLSATGHDYEAAVTAPTCTEAGYTTYTCNCGDTYTDDEVVALGHDYEAVVTAPTCTEAGYTTYTCNCGDTYSDDEVVALGHNWSNLALATAPTYEARGALSGTCANCDSTSIEIPAVSAENGYTALITGVLTRWQYTFNNYTFIVDLANEVETTEYSYGTEAWYVGTDDLGAFVFVEGYKYTDAQWNLNANGYFAQAERTYVTTIKVLEPTTVTLLINCGRNKEKPFFATDGNEHIIDNLMVNGSTANVICDMNSTLSILGWENFNSYEVATLFLSEGENIISFVTANGTNMKGIGFKSTCGIHMHTDVIDAAVAPICTAEGLTMGVHCSDCNKVIVAQETIPVSGVHTFATEYSLVKDPHYISEGQIAKICTVCGVLDEESIITLPKVSEENGYTLVSSTDTQDNWTYTYAEQTFDIVITTFFDFTVADNNPFLAANGGSFGSSTWNKDGFYENTKNQTFTVTITVEEATDAVFMIKIGRKGQTEKISDLFTYLKVNETEMTESINTAEITGGASWAAKDSVYATIATIHLNKGTNVITFTRGDTENSVANFNVFGVAFESNAPIELGAAETEE